MSVKDPGPSKIPLFGDGPGFGLPLEGAINPPDQVPPVTAPHSTISYKVVENMNSRTAEQGTTEYRSEKIVDYLLGKPTRANKKSTIIIKVLVSARMVAPEAA